MHCAAIRGPFDCTGVICRFQVLSCDHSECTPLFPLFISLRSRSPKPYAMIISSWNDCHGQQHTSSTVPGSIESIIHTSIYTFTSLQGLGDQNSTMKDAGQNWKRVESQQTRESTGGDRYRKNMTKQNLSLYFTCRTKAQSSEEVEHKGMRGKGDPLLARVQVRICNVQQMK